MSFTPTARPGTLHHYTSRLTAFEHAFEARAAPAVQNTILFIGGLGDGLLHVRYPALLAKHLPPGWSVAEVLLSSSYGGWSTSSLHQDAEELATAISYFRALPGRRKEDGAKIVIAGHSTGCQVCMEYNTGPWKVNPVPQTTLDRPLVDAVILQAGISDREGIEMLLSAEEFQVGLVLAKSWIDDGRGDVILPKFATKRVFGSDPTARRWYSLASVQGDDDYFSSDLPDEILDRTFGTLGQRHIPVCIFLGGADEHMPDFVDKSGLINRWKDAVARAGGVAGQPSGVIEGATHNLNGSGEETRALLCDKICKFVTQLDESKK